MSEVKGSTKPRRRLGWGYLTGLIILGLLVLLVGTGTAFYFRVPHKLGLIESPAERLLWGTPDPETAATIKEDIRKADIPTQGVEVYVVPFTGRPKNLTVIVLDASQGFRLAATQRGDPITEYMTALSKARQLGVFRVAVQYLDEAGKELVTLTAPANAITAYSQGLLDRAQFLEKVEAKFENTSILMDFAADWGVTKGIVDKDKEGNARPTAGAVARAAGSVLGVPVSTGDEEADAALDAGVVLKSIVEAERAASKGRQELAGGNPTAALEHFNQAVLIRPHDWAYRQERAVALMEVGKTDLAYPDFKVATEEACQQPSWSQCVRALRERARLLDESLKRQQQKGRPTCSTYREQSLTSANLYIQTKEKRYQALTEDMRLKGQVESGLCLP